MPVIIENYGTSIWTIDNPSTWTPKTIFGWTPPDLTVQPGDWWRIATPWAVLPLDKRLPDGKFISDQFNPAETVKKATELDPMFWIKIAIGYIVISKGNF